MKKYLLLSIALSTPHILFADQGTEISSTESLRQGKATPQENPEFSATDIVINRIQNHPKLSKSFKEACLSCNEEVLSSFNNRTLPHEQMKQIANVVKDFAQKHGLAPEMQSFPKK